MAATLQGSRTSILELQETIRERYRLQIRNLTPLSPQQSLSTIKLSKTAMWALSSAEEENRITCLSQMWFSPQSRLVWSYDGVLTGLRNAVIWGWQNGCQEPAQVTVSHGMQPFSIFKTWVIEERPVPQKNNLAYYTRLSFNIPKNSKNTNILNQLWVSVESKSK